MTVMQFARQSTVRARKFVAGAALCGAFGLPLTEGTAQPNVSGVPLPATGQIKSVPAEFARGVMRNEMELRANGDAKYDLLLFGVLFSASVMSLAVAIKPKPRKPRALDFSDATGFACGGCGHEHGEKKAGVNE